MRFVNEYTFSVLHDTETNTVRELSPLELDAFISFGDSILNEFPLEGPSGYDYND